MPWPLLEPDDPDELEPVERDDDPPALQVALVPRQVIEVLLGPDGEPLRYLLDRPTVPFGFVVPGTTAPPAEVEFGDE